MKTPLLILSFFFSGSLLYSQNLDCSRFKDGKFRIPGSNGETPTFIFRKGDSQIETNENRKVVIQFKVTWLDECTYTLKVDSVLKNENNFPFPLDMILKVKIVGVLKDSYLQESTSNTFTGIYKSEVLKIQ
jgi:hypothetical protein